MMRFQHTQLNFEVTYESHRSCLNKIEQFWSELHVNTKCLPVNVNITVPHGITVMFTVSYVQWRMYMVKLWMPPYLGVQILSISCSFWEIWQNCMQPPPQGWHPHLREILDQPLFTILISSQTATHVYCSRSTTTHIFQFFFSK